MCYKFSQIMGGILKRLKVNVIAASSAVYTVHCVQFTEPYEAQ